MLTVKFINELIEICFSAGILQFKVDQCYPINLSLVMEFLGNVFTTVFSGP